MCVHQLAQTVEIVLVKCHPDLLTRFFCEMKPADYFPGSANRVSLLVIENVHSPNEIVYRRPAQADVDILVDGRARTMLPYWELEEGRSTPPSPSGMRRRRASESLSIGA
jgi:hypothetical protein